MGWQKTDVEGRVMWERNGMRVETTEQADMIDSMNSRSREPDFKIEPPEFDEVQDGAGCLVIVGLVVAWLVMWAI